MNAATWALALFGLVALTVGYRIGAANGWGRPVLKRNHIRRRTAAQWLVRPFSLVELLAKREAMRPDSGAFDYDPLRWRGVAESAFNCYGYAIDVCPGRVGHAHAGRQTPFACLDPRTMSAEDRSRLGYRALPGGGWAQPTLTRRVLRRVLVHEGLQKANWRSLRRPAEGRWLVAVGFDPYARDAHFWLLHRDGRWSNKPGDWPISDLDAADRRIRTPRRARSGNVYWLLGHFWVVPERTAAFRLFTGGELLPTAER